MSDRTTDLTVKITGLDTDRLEEIEAEMAEGVTFADDLDEMLYRHFAEDLHADPLDVSVERRDSDTDQGGEQ